MMDKITFKIVEEQDLSLILDIYNHYIVTTTATFRLTKISIETLKSFIFLNNPRYKAFLIYLQNEVTGFCFITQYKNLEAYDRTAEIGIYLKPDFTKKGIGLQAIKHLESVAEKSSLRILIASISGENTASIKLFQKLNYTECGHFKDVGEKFNRVLDVIYFQKRLVSSNKV